jgi:hypothetical protein
MPGHVGDLDQVRATLHRCDPVARPMGVQGPMAATNKCLAESNKSPHRANATKKRKARDSRQPRTTNMTRLLLCTATLLALTGSANAQRESGNYMGGFHGTNTLGSFLKVSTCSWSIAKGWPDYCPATPQQAQPQRIKQPRR